MQFGGGGGRGFIRPGKEGSFYVEYQIKNNVDINQVKKML
jgi:hypothetical protein